MKTRRLPEIDLARFAALPPGPQLDCALRMYHAGGGFWSYDPVRASTSDIVGARTPLLGPLPQTPWEKIERQIKSACRKGESQVKANTQVGKVLFDVTRASGWSAVKFPMGRLPIGIGETVRFWSDVLLADEGGLFIPFFDHRREHGIANQSARQIVFSMQHLWIRERHPDICLARLAVVRFPSEAETRGIRIDFHTEADLLSYEQLNERVCTVYDAWMRISAERTRDSRRTGTGSGNPFGF